LERRRTILAHKIWDRPSLHCGYPRQGHQHYGSVVLLKQADRLIHLFIEYEILDDNDYQLILKKYILDFLGHTIAADTEKVQPMIQDFKIRL
jgi:hypothetical protein